MTSLVTHRRLALNFPREVGQMAKKWSKNGLWEDAKKFRHRINTFRPGARTTAGFRPQDCGYVGIWTSFVTYVRGPLNFPGEVGEMAKKWSKNDPLVVGGRRRRQIKLDRTLPHFQWERNSKLC